MIFYFLIVPHVEITARTLGLRDTASSGIRFAA